MTKITMKRVNAILEHPLFISTLAHINELERDRLFCKHGLEHLVDVARISYILSLESKSDTEYLKELFYAAALLHDLGRGRQYEDGTPHEHESAKLAEKILPECGYDQSEVELILDAILSHRSKMKHWKTALAEYIYRADKLSRRCDQCAKLDECDWVMKNIGIEY